MAEGNVDPEDLIESEVASKLDNFGEEKKDSSDYLFFADAQENAGGEGENAIATDLDSNTIVQLAKAKRNRNRNRRRRNKNRQSTDSAENPGWNFNSDFDDSKISDMGSNDTLVGTDTEDTKIVVTVTDISLSSDEVPHENNLEQIVEGNSSTTIVERIDEDSTHSISQNSADVENKDSNASGGFSYENNPGDTFEGYSSITFDDRTECNATLGISQNSIEVKNEESDSNASNGENGPFPISSDLNIIYQADGVIIPQMGNSEGEVNSEEKTINSDTLEDSSEYYSFTNQENSSNNTSFSQDVKSEIEVIRQDNPVESEIIVNSGLEENLTSCNTSNSYVHLQVPNPSIEHLEGNEFNGYGADRGTTPGVLSSFESENKYIGSTPSPTEVGEILQQACIIVEQGMKSSSNLNVWGVDATSAIQTSEEDDSLVSNTSLFPKELSTTEEQGMAPVSNVNDLGQDINDETDVTDSKPVFPTRVSSVDFENTSIALSLEERASVGVIEGTEPEYDVSSILSLLSQTNSKTGESKNEGESSNPFENKSSVNVLYQSEVQVHSSTYSSVIKTNAEALDKLNREWDAFANEEDRLNNNYWPQDTKSEINLLNENVELETELKTVPSTAKTGEQSARVNSRRDQGIQSNITKNVWSVGTSTVQQALVGAQIEDEEQNKEISKWSWKNLFPCSGRSKSRDRQGKRQSNSAVNIAEGEFRKKRGLSLPRFKGIITTDVATENIRRLPRR